MRSRQLRREIVHRLICCADSRQYSDETRYSRRVGGGVSSLPLVCIFETSRLSVLIPLSIPSVYQCIPWHLQCILYPCVYSISSDVAAADPLYPAISTIPVSSWL